MSTTNVAPTWRGSILRIADATNSFVHRFLPDPYVIGAVLIAVIFLWGVLATPTTPAQMMKYFGDGLWSLVGFAMQLAIVIVTSQALVNTPPWRGSSPAWRRCPGRPRRRPCSWACSPR